MNETKKKLEDTKSYIVELAPRVQTEKLTFPIGKLLSCDEYKHYKSLLGLCLGWYGHLMVLYKTINLFGSLGHHQSNYVLPIIFS